METISITTIKDIVDKVPMEDIDSFLVDLKKRVEIHKTVKNMPLIVSKYPDTIMWKNDGKNDATISFVV